MGPEDYARGRSVEQLYLLTMLHEMTHAFLSFYTCQCGACRSMIASARGGIGDTGHGPAWADAILAVGQAFQDQVAWDAEDLGIVDSVVHEIQASRGWEPTVEQLGRWGIMGGAGGGVRRRQPQYHMYQASVDDRGDDPRHGGDTYGPPQPSGRAPSRPSTPPPHPPEIHIPRGNPHRPRSRSRPTPPDQRASDIDAAIAASLQDAEDEALRRALAQSTIDAGNGPRPRPRVRVRRRSRPRVRDPNRGATEILVAQLDAESEQAASEAAIRRILADDAR